MQKAWLRLAIALLIAALLLSPAGAEETESEGVPFAAQGEETGETRIDPAYEVPQYVAWLLDTARQEIGYTEEKGGATKYGVWTGDPTAEWCAEFLCWCVHQVDQKQGTKLLNNTYPYYTGTNTGRDWFIRQGRYIARRGTVPGWGSQWFKGEKTPVGQNGYVPQPGDWVFFSTNSFGDTSHVAMVEYCSCDEQGKIFVHVIEGNNPDSVARNVYALDYWAILGYGTVYDLADIAMRFGNAGEKVTALQKKLIAAGTLGSQYATGKYGALTTQAVKDFQKRMGLEQTGLATHETQLALGEYVAAQALSAAPSGEAADN